MKKPSKEDLLKALQEFKDLANNTTNSLVVKRNARMAIIILTRQLKESHG